MVSLPELSFYSEEQKAQARALSPAFLRYERLLSLLPIGDLHRQRHEAWLKCVAATYSKTATTAEICGYWSQVADALLERAWNESGLDQTAAVLLALGKQGARELNLSSDIDLMIVSEPRDAAKVERGLRHFQKLIHQPTANGFCFRLDFDLRPGGKLGPLITSPSQFQDHYWSQGETWERLALVRLRPIAGHTGVARNIQDLAQRFSYRKFLDFTLLEDLKALRTRVHHESFARRDQEIHLKLEIGGIRDIELFVHSLLVLHGGKLPALQTASTGEALSRLREHQLLPAVDADFLIKTYWSYRHMENCIQAVEDRQTHSLTETALFPALRSQMSQVDKLVSSLLGSVDLSVVHLPPTENGQRKWLSELGFSTEVIETTWSQLIKATALSNKNDRDERARQEFLYTFVSELAKNEGLDRDLGLNILVDFVRATRAKATFFSMLLRSPRLIQDLARLFCLSPYLGSILASRPELLDHFILKVDDGWAEDPETLLQQMAERKLLTELWSASQFLNDGDLNAMFERITQTADSICRQLLLQLKREYPESRLEIVALGKWAGRELGLRSDLDFIFVTPSAPVEADFKVARRMISRLTDNSKSGSLYDLDLRLRPSGQSGALLVETAKLMEFWSESAPTWQRQAYLRAAALNPDVKLEKNRLIAKPLRTEDREELKDIRGKLLKPNEENRIDIKYAPGGLVDIEFVVQTALLAGQIEATCASTLDMLAKLSWGKDGEHLRRIYLRLRVYEQMLQLSSTFKTAEVRLNSPVFIKAASLLKLSPEEAWEELNETLLAAQNLLDRLDPSGFAARR